MTDLGSILFWVGLMLYSVVFAFAYQIALKKVNDLADLSRRELLIMQRDRVKMEYSLFDLRAKEFELMVKFLQHQAYEAGDKDKIKGMEAHLNNFKNHRKTTLTTFEKLAKNITEEVDRLWG